MAENTPKEHNKKRAKRKWRLVVIGLVAALPFVLLAVWLFQLYSREPTISVDYVAEWYRIAKPADYDPNQDAAFDYQKAIDAFVQTPDQIDFAETRWPGDMNDTLLGTLDKWLNENSASLIHLKRGSRKPYCWIRDSYRNNSLAQWAPGLLGSHIRRLAWLIGWHAKFEATKGQTDRAVDGIIAGYRLASHFMGTKPLIYQLTGMGFRSRITTEAFIILDKQHLGPKTLQYFQQQLQQHFEESGNQMDFQYERLCLCDVIQHVFTDDSKGSGRLIPEAAVVLLFSLPPYALGTQPSRIIKQKAWEYSRQARAIWLAAIGPDRKETTAMANNLFDYYETLKDKTFWELRQKEAESITKMHAVIEEHVVLYWADTNYHVLELYQRMRAQETALIATLAVLRYRQEQGRYPQELDELVADGYLKELPADPFSDGSLIYKRLEDNFTLYSFAEDCDDDGGARSHWGMGEEGGDMVFWPVKRPEKNENEDN